MKNSNAMSQYDELKRLAEAATQGDWTHSKHGVIKGGPAVQFTNGSSQQQIVMTTGADWMKAGEQYANADFIAAANPAAVLALIAENERDELALRAFSRVAENAVAERDQLRAEVAGLKTGYQAYEQVNAELKAEMERLQKTKSEPCDGCFMAEAEALRKDKDRLDALEGNFWDVRFDSSPNGDAGDSSVSIEIVGHWMDKPNERVIGENYNENLRAAIDQAMKAPAYPPARPEYPEFDDIPDFTPGNGNSARRRAESLGIDYDTAMGKGGQS